jgi:hypothetical protein
MKKKHAFKILALVMLMVCFSVLQPLAVPADQPPQITANPARVSDLVALSSDPAAPTTVLGDDYIYWTYAVSRFSGSTAWPAHPIP